MQDKIIQRANKSFENKAKFKYVGTTIIIQNDFHVEIMSRESCVNACYHLVQKPSIFPSTIYKPKPKIKCKEMYNVICSSLWV